jgi:hypothetical protein
MSSHDGSSNGRGGGDNSDLDMDGDDPRFEQALGLVRQLSQPNLKEQCLRAEWASLHTDLERDLLVSVVSDSAFWAEVKEAAAEEIETAGADDTGDSEGARDERLLKMFKAFDKDDSGSIDAHELHQMLLYMGITTSVEDVRAMIDRVDENGDGTIDEAEFLHIMKSAQQQGGVAALLQPEGVALDMTVGPRAIQQATANATANQAAQQTIRDY